jgi:hypothetical protein
MSAKYARSNNSGLKNPAASLVKFHSVKRLAIIGLAIGTLSIVLSSCSNADTVKHQGSSSKASATTSSVPTTSKSTTSAEVGVVKLAQGGIAADGLPYVKGTGKTITDKYGTYETVAVPDAPTLKYDEKSLKKYGYTKGEAEDAAKWFNEFYSSQGYDSTVIDSQTNAEWFNWLEMNEGKYFIKEIWSPLKGLTSDGQKYTPIYNNPTNDYSAFARDGKTRLSSFDTTYDTVNGGVSGSGYGNYVQFHGTSILEYRVPAKSTASVIESVNPSKSVADLKAEFPKAFDDKDDLVKMTVNFFYGVKKQNGEWRIGGFSNDIHSDIEYQ